MILNMFPQPEDIILNGFPDLKALKDFTMFCVVEAICDVKVIYSAVQV